MGKFSDILLTVDFDRTLTAPDSSIPEENLRAIEYFMAEGGAFTLNTGRSLPMVAELMDRIPVNAPLLLYNGSAAYDWQKQAFTFQHPIDLNWVDAVKRCRELLPDLTVEIQGANAHYILGEDPVWAAFTHFQHPIDLNWVDAVKRCRELLPDLTVEIQGANAHYILGEDPVWAAFTQANRCPWAYVTEEDVIDPFLKFTVYGKITQNNVAHLFDATPEEQAQIDEAEVVLNREFGEKTSIFRAARRIIDLHSKGVSKGRSARELQQKLGSDEAEVVLNREFGEKTSIFRAARRIIDLHSKGVSKGRSARELQQKLGRKILVCVGDGENDLTMLDMADHAYCPADAVIRERYENVCPCAEGAVADGENDLTMLDMADHAYCPADAVIRERYENVCPCAEGAVADVIRNKLPEILK